ncbi:hypothetical protein F5Y00DRAFT_234562 [Daldinia vernicosa]|uniref:uncharacterized protein n=1 Tax=Daldinia vernicosa TaxID=114800 RepID=UPI0020077513|nr:uncharacterized protein F5Y00DRAFT_234562 [Daldinia vernicosa]KAI0849707.1 hypothetical protein F5Y00DRAFT_234562 [Daldinia vernicosa]
MIRRRVARLRWLYSAIAMHVRSAILFDDRGPIWSCYRCYWIYVRTDGPSIVAPCRFISEIVYVSIRRDRRHDAGMLTC